MLPVERQKLIMDILAKQGLASVGQLGLTLSVSEVTIRRDLACLEREALLRRTYGGAVGTDMTFFEVSVNAKMAQFVEEKKRIGKAAADLVQDGDIVFLDAGSTTFEVAKCLRDKHLTVVTNALNIAAEFSVCNQIEIHVIGGVLKRGHMSLIGPQAEAFLKEVRADKLVLGVEGVDVRGGFTVPDVIEAHTKKAMIRSARRTIVVADHSKLGRNTLTTIVPLAEAGLLITDKGADASIVEQLIQHIEVLLV